MGRKRLERLYAPLEIVIEKIDTAELIIVVTAFLGIIGINTMEIFTRFALNKSFFWVYEITLLLANIMYFLGGALVYKRRHDIQMEYFLKFISRDLQRKWDFVIDGVCFYFFVIVLYHGVRLLAVQSKHVSQGLGIPNHYFSLPLVLGAVSMALIIVQQFLEKLLPLEGKERI